MLSRSPEGGFSLIELLVAITVLALLIAAAGPSTASWVRSAHTQNAAEAAQNGLRRARTEAMRRQRPVTLWLVTSAERGTLPDDSCRLSDASPSWVISLDDPTGSCATPPSADAEPRIIETAGIPVPQGLAVRAFSSAGSPAHSVTFDASGARIADVDAIGRIDVTHPDSSVRALRIEVSASGSIRLCDRVLPAGGDDPKACAE